MFLIINVASGMCHSHPQATELTASGSSFNADRDGLEVRLLIQSFVERATDVVVVE